MAKEKEQKMIYETLHIKLKIKKYKRHLKTGGEIRCSGRVSSSCSTSGTHHVTLVTNPVISPLSGKDQKMFTTNGTYP